jgi:hypothetical protein
MLNVVLISVFVTLFSASFAEFKPSITDESFTGIYPMAMLLYWGTGTMVPLFFYKLDVTISSGLFDVVSIVILSSTALLIIISTALCYYFGIRRIKTYSQ